MDYEKEIEDFLNDIEYCDTNKINKLVIFVKSPTILENIKKFIDVKNIEMNIIGVTFPANEPIYLEEENENGDSTIKEYIPEAADGDKVYEALKSQGIQLIRSTLPFQGIVIPGENYNPYQIISNTMDLIYNGLSNIIQTIMIATDNGAVSPNERVVVANKVLFVDLNGVNSRMLFHPDLGLKINNIYKK